jgi:hypothetical protein
MATEFPNLVLGHWVSGFTPFPLVASCRRMDLTADTLPAFELVDFSGPPAGRTCGSPHPALHRFMPLVWVIPRRGESMFDNRIHIMMLRPTVIDLNSYIYFGKIGSLFNNP